MTSTRHTRCSRGRPAISTLVVVLAVVATGCPGDDDAGPADTAGTSGPSAVTTADTTAARSPADVGIIVNPEAPTCVYRGGEILAEIENAEEQAAVDAVVDDEAESGIVPVADDELTPGLVIVPVNEDPFAVAQRLASDGVEASPNYIFAFAPGWKYAPDDTPQRHGAQVGRELSDAEVSIAVLDTGYEAVQSEAPPATVTEVITPAVPDPRTTNQPTELHDGVAAGHGTFIVNALGQLLPGATITPAAIGARWDHDDQLAVPTPGGQPANVRDDSTVTSALVALAGEGRFDYLNLSFGTYGCTALVPDTADTPEELGPYLPLGLRTALENWGARAQVFAASGNDGNRPEHPEVFYPAGWAPLYPWLYSIASDPRDDDDYSNRGAWVEHQARGTRVVSRLPGTTHWGAEDWYSWSGTSFATPCALAAHAADIPLEPASLDGTGNFTDCAITIEAPR